MRLDQLVEEYTASQHSIQKSYAELGKLAQNTGGSYIELLKSLDTLITLGREYRKQILNAVEETNAKIQFIKKSYDAERFIALFKRDIGISMDNLRELPSFIKLLEDFIHDRSLKQLEEMGFERVDVTGTVNLEIDNIYQTIELLSNNPYYIMPVKPSALIFDPRLTSYYPNHRGTFFQQVLETYKEAIGNELLEQLEP